MSPEAVGRSLPRAVIRCRKTGGSETRRRASARISPSAGDRDGDLLPGRAILKRNSPDLTGDEKRGADREGTVECAAPPQIPSRHQSNQQEIAVEGRDQIRQECCRE